MALSPNRWRDLPQLGAVVLDPVVENMEHAAFNYCIAASAAIAFTPNTVLLQASASHLDYLKRTTDLFREYPVKSQATATAPRRARDTTRISFELSALITAMRLAHHKDRRPLVVLNATTSSLWALALARLIAKIGGFSVPTILFLHSVLAEVWGWRSRNPLRRCLDTRSALTVLSFTRTRLCVLEPGIHRELAATSPRIAACTSIIPLPIPDGEALAGGTRLSAPIRFGFLGRAMQSKNFHVFLEIASAVRQTSGNKVEFHAIGAQVDRFAPDLLDNLSTKPSERPLDRKTYLSMIRDLHYVLLLNGEAYRYFASASALDAIAALRPVIALDAPGCRELLGSSGDIGFLCKDTAAIVALAILLADKPDPRRYALQVENVSKLRHERSLLRTAERLRDLLPSLVRA